MIEAQLSEDDIVRILDDYKRVQYSALQITKTSTLIVTQNYT